MSLSMLISMMSINAVKLSLKSFDVDAITKRDINLARKIEELLLRYSKTEYFESRSFVIILYPPVSSNKHEEDIKSNRYQPLQNSVESAITS